MSSLGHRSRRTQNESLFAWCGFWSRGIIEPIFLENEQSRSLAEHIERIFVHKNWRGGFWQHLVSTGRRYVPHSRSYTRCFEPFFLKVALSAAELMSFGHLAAAIWHRWTLIWGLTIDTLNDNIQEAIDEIQLHTIDNVLKNCTGRLGYCMASRASHLDCTFI